MPHAPGETAAAREFFEKNRADLELVLSKAVNKFLRVRPPEPLRYMADELARYCTDGGRTLTELETSEAQLKGKLKEWREGKRQHTAHFEEKRLQHVNESTSGDPEMQ
eukprot:4730415-Prymnesium_polylepis.1